MNLAEILNYGAAVVGVLALLAAGIVRWRSSSDDTTAELWRREAEAWRAKAERFEKEFAELRLRVEHVEAENRSLRSLHDSSAAIAALRADMSAGFLTLAELIREGRD